MPADPSLNDLIRPLEERRRDGQAEGLGGLEVDDDPYPEGPPIGATRDLED
jgi:hypothetical protein